jgi:hypothetical protein
MAMARLRALIAALPLLMAVLAVLPGLAAPVDQQSPGTVPVGELKGVVNPVMVRYVDRII